MAPICMCALRLAFVYSSPIYIFFWGGAFVLFRNTGSSFRCESQVGRSFSRRNSAHSNFFQKHLDVGCLTTIRYADAWHQQCTCFFSRCIKSSLSRCCVLDLVNAAFPFLGLFFFLFSFFLIFLAANERNS